MRRSGVRQNCLAVAAAHAGRAARCRPPQPDPTLRQRPLCGLTIIWGLQPNGANHWSNGSLYDPQDGTTYDVTAERTSPDRISARVYRGVPLFGRTEILIRDPQLSFDGRC